MPAVGTGRARQFAASEDLATRYQRVRATTRRLAAPLTAEDCMVQSMPDVSPTRWHLGHTTWFFETFVLPLFGKHETFQPGFEVLFNSYYKSVGPQFPRAQRGVISRPGLAEVMDYRSHVDAQVHEKLANAETISAQDQFVIELGLHHEQQHQELLLTDIKHVFSCNPMFPTYETRDPEKPVEVPAATWTPVPSGVQEIGWDSPDFAFDNERPRHQVVIPESEICSRLVNNGEYQAFIGDGGYRRPELWLSEGWAWVEESSRTAPLYWLDGEGRQEFTLHGCQDLAPHRPVSHVSYFEADAYARWAGARLPTEAEWESLASTQPLEGNLLDSGNLTPEPPSGNGKGVQQMYGDLWEWTSSPYTSYPGYRPFQGSLGEYNGKFMCDQWILRGGSFATARDHIRPTYRNFFPANTQWQFTGIRLARDAS